MSERSALQRFFHELRRRHVPQTAAVYAVAAWAAIQFADVVVPNLGWPENIVTAVIIAAAVGLPVVLVLAWVFEWGPEGLHRTPSEEADGQLPSEGGDWLAGPGTRAPSRSTSGPWVTALAVLVVGIASALAVAVVLDRGDEGGAPAAGATPGVRGGDGDGVVPGPPAPPGIADNPLGILSEEFADSMARIISEVPDLSGLAELRKLGNRFGPGRSLLIASPSAWTLEPGEEPLPEGDTLVVQGIARDTAGVAAVAVDGVVAGEAEGAAQGTLPFRATLVGTGDSGVRMVPIRVTTGDGREVIREFPIRQIPGG